MTPDTNIPKPSIGLITALPEEYLAVEALLENRREHQTPGRGAGRRYCIGQIPSVSGGNHEVALTQAGMGNNSATARAALLLERFPTVEYVIMVGIAGGAPNAKRSEGHVRLGDIVVSAQGGVVQFDFVKETEKKIIPRHRPRPPSPVLLAADGILRDAELKRQQPWVSAVRVAIQWPLHAASCRQTQMLLERQRTGQCRRRVLRYGARQSVELCERGRSRRQRARSVVAGRTFADSADPWVTRADEPSA